MKLTENMQQSFGATLRFRLEKINNGKKRFFIGLLFFAGAYFHSQAVLFNAAVPFFLPIWALVHARFRPYLIWVFMGGMIGSVFLGMGQVCIHLLQLLLYTAVSKYAFTQKSPPLTVAGSIIVVQVIWQFVMYAGQPPLDVQVAIGMEALLAIFMTFFLFLAFPSMDQLFWGRSTSEQIGAACIVGAMATTGMSQFVIGHLSLAGVLLHLTILMAAYIGGLPFSTSVAMLIAAIAGLSELSFTGMMAVYGMSGFLAGALRRFGKLGISFGAFGVSLFFFLYDVTLPLDQTYFISIGVATFLFFFIPTKAVEPIRKIFYPERLDVAEKRQQWLTERLDEQLVEFQQFAELMSTLVTDRFTKKNRPEMSLPPQYPNVCQSCFRRQKCWGEAGEMDQFIQEWEYTYSMTKKASRHRVEEKMKYKCVRFNGLISELEERAAKRLLMGQLHHGRKMLALQLRDMSTHLDKLMNEIKEDLTVYRSDEEELARKFNEHHIPFYQIDILSGEKGERRIVCCVPEKKSSFETDVTVAERLILPILEEMFEEPFRIEKSVSLVDPFPHCQLAFCSSVRFKLEYGVVSTAGNGSFYAGDAHEVFRLHEGLMAVLLSDGMGQDMNAYHESRKVIRLMRECLDRKMDPETAMHTLHYMMSLNGLDDMYATVDLALIDLQAGRLWSWKAGSMSTYIKRGDTFLRLDSMSVPVGFMPAFSIEAKKEELKAGDVLVMMTDGIFNPEIPLEIQEKTLYHTLEKYYHFDCDRIADRLMQEMERKYQSVVDDRTVLVLKIDHTISEWASFSPRAQVISQEKMTG